LPNSRRAVFLPGDLLFTGFDSVHDSDKIKRFLKTVKTKSNVNALASFTGVGAQPMQIGYVLHRRLAWLALCAIIFAALAPSVSKLLATSQGSAWNEICSLNGTKLLSVDLSTKPPPDAPIVADKHCGYCFLQQHSPFVPTPPYSLAMEVASADCLPVGSGGTTFFKRFIRDARHTRAPPAFS
jgi:hypothetical protein